MKTALKIAWRYLFAKKQFNAIHIITAISSVAVGVVTAAMICVLSVMNGFGVMIEHLFSQFDPDLRITSQSGKSFVISEEKKSKLLELPSINLISESISETALAYFEEKQMPVQLMGVDSVFGQLTNIENIIEQVAQLECIKPYILCGGTALAMQVGHRKSEDLDFMMWRISKTEKPEVNWNLIEKELKEKIGEIENFNMLGFDQVEFVVKGVKFSFFVSDNLSPVTKPIDYLGNIRLADIESIMAMKMEVMLRRMKFRDYYDIYCMLQEGYSIHNGMEKALNLSRHRLSSKNIVAMLLGGQFIPDNNFATLEPKYDVTKEQIREYVMQKLKE